MLAAYALVVLDQPLTALPIFAGSLIAGALAFAEYWAPPRLRAVLRAPSALALATGVALAASVVVTEVVNQKQPLDSYWPSFGLWLAAIALVVAAGVQPLLPAATSPWSAATSWARQHRGEIAIVAGLIAIATLARTVALATIPSPYSGDEAAHLLQSLNVGKGIDSMFRSGLQGQPTMYYFGLRATTLVFGDSPAASFALM